MYLFGISRIYYSVDRNYVTNSRRRDGVFIAQNILLLKFVYKRYVIYKISLICI